MKIAQFKNIEHGFNSIQGEEFEEIRGYVRLSEYLDVEFSPISDDSQIQKHVAALDKVRQGVVYEFTRKLADIDRQKSELLAITHNPGAV